MWGLNAKKKSDLAFAAEENFTFLGRDVDFKGVATFDGTVRIDGHFEGEIHAKGSLVLGEHAIIKGLITTGTLVCGGKVHGNITGTDKVQLLKSSVVIGDVRTPRFSMEEGAHFHGLCDMGADKLVEEDQREAGGHENVHDLAAHRGKARVQDIS
jgi:cytoskeletal protein CcmA (bactofilin family)